MASKDVSVVEGANGRKEVIALPIQGFWRWLRQEMVAFALVHYILWALPVWAVSTLLWRVHATIGPALVTGAALAYVVTFTDGCERKSGRPWDGFRVSRLWRLLHSYFPLHAIRMAPLDPQRQYIFGWHPHGTLVLSRIFCYGGVWEHLFPGLDFRVLGATPMFFVPFCRDICLWMRAVDASRKTTEYNLKKGMSVLVYPGGSKEIFETDGGNPKTVVYVRTGFIRMALRYGCDLVPVFVYGEKHCYHRFHIPDGVRKFLLKHLRIPLIVFWGRFFTWLPYRTPMTCVFGEPLPVDKVEDPTEAQVIELHGAYCKALAALFETHKGEAGYGKDEVLVIR